MAARVTAEAVKEIIRTSLSNDVILTSQINTANIFVDEYLESSGLSDAMLTQVELYLAAHFVALTDEGAGLTRDKLGDADQSYANVYGQGLKSTRYGQTAMALDTTGVLANLTQPMLKANFRIV